MSYPEFCVRFGFSVIWLSGTCLFYLIVIYEIGDACLETDIEAVVEMEVLLALWALGCDENHTSCGTCTIKCCIIE